MAIEFVNPPAISAVTYHMKEVSFMDDIQSNEQTTSYASHAQAKAAMLDEATALVRCGYKITRSRGHSITLQYATSEVRLLTYEINTSRLG